MEYDTLLAKALAAPASRERAATRALVAALLRRPSAQPVAVAEPALLRCVAQLLAAPSALTLDEAVRGLTQLIHAGANPRGSFGG
jgi:hypothetical protein